MICSCSAGMGTVVQTEKVHVYVSYRRIKEEASGTTFPRGRSVLKYRQPQGSGSTRTPAGLILVFYLRLLLVSLRITGSSVNCLIEIAAHSDVLPPSPSEPRTLRGAVRRAVAELPMCYSRTVSSSCFSPQRRSEDLPMFAHSTLAQGMDSLYIPAFRSAVLLL